MTGRTARYPEFESFVTMRSILYMYLYRTSVKESLIEGRGVFAMESIIKGSVVWKFDHQHDCTMSQEDFEDLDNNMRSEIRKIGYVSPTSHNWVYPPENDPARFTNHSSSSNNLSAVFDPHVSSEPFFVANRNILEGEELTNNYGEFDESIKNAKPMWM